MTTPPDKPATESSVPYWAWRSPSLRGEKAMRPAVYHWLRERCDCVCIERYIKQAVDMVGFSFGPRDGRLIPDVSKVVAVELKLRDFAGVIRQAKINLRTCHESWAAMPFHVVAKMRPATVAKFVTSGVGLLSVDGDAVKVVVSACVQVNDYWSHPHTKRSAWRSRGLVRRRPYCFAKSEQ